jgi:tripartite-type tricarboxylate transporter receptor subunit TctC
VFCTRRTSDVITLGVGSLMLSRRAFLGSAVAASSLPLSTISFAQSNAYPSKEIHAVCGFPAGTTADIWVRFFGQQLTNLCGKPVIVENRPGAFGLLATEQVVRSKPDGYTIFIAPGASSLAAAKHLYKSVSFDPINDFDHITPAVKQAFVLCVPANSPNQSVNELINFLRVEKGGAFYGTTTNTAVVASALFLRQFNLEATAVAYRSTTDSLNEIRSGKLSFQFVDPGTVGELVRAGHLRALCTTAQERMEGTPDIPSAKDAGLTMDIISWWSIHAPKGLPVPVFDQLETWFNQIVRSDATREFLKRQGASPYIGDSKSLKELVVRENEAWEKYVAVAKIQKL